MWWNLLFIQYLKDFLTQFYIVRKMMQVESVNIFDIPEEGIELLDDL